MTYVGFALGVVSRVFIFIWICISYINSRVLAVRFADGDPLIRSFFKFVDHKTEVITTTTTSSFLLKAINIKEYTEYIYMYHIDSFQASERFVSREPVATTDNFDRGIR